MRKFYRLTDLNNGNAYMLPESNYLEAPIGMSPRNSLMPAIGADGAFDLHGSLQSPLADARAAMQFALVSDCPSDLQSRINDLLVGVYGSTRSVGKRKLWRWDEGIQTNRRWTYARPSVHPQLPRGFLNVRHAEVSVEFALPEPMFYEPITSRWLLDRGYTPVQIVSPGEPILPDTWFASFVIASSPAAFTIVNTGNKESLRMVFRVESLGANGYSALVISNSTTGKSFSSSASGANSSHVSSFNTAPGLGRSQKSVDGGASWTNDNAALSIPSAQAVMMELAPGSNNFQITCGGTPNYRLLVWHLSAWRD